VRLQLQHRLSGHLEGPRLQELYRHVCEGVLEELPPLEYMSIQRPFKITVSFLVVKLSLGGGYWFYSKLTKIFNLVRAVIVDDDDDDEEVVEVTPPSRPAYFFRENGLELEVPEDDEDNEGLGAREVKKFDLHVVTLPPNFDAQEEECFCQEPFAGTRVVFMACLHKMHYNCFVKWAQGSRVCPYCRRDMLHGAAVDGRARDGQGSSANT